MMIRGRIFATVISTLVFLFSLIHLGLSIGIIADFRKYGDIFRPQIGLSGYNIAVSFFGLVAGTLGLLSTLFGSKLLGRIGALVSIITGIFALASLVTAIIINDKSPSYVRSRFEDNMMNFMKDAGARERIDLVQSNYECCGADIWLDWANAALNSNASITTTTMTTTMPSANDTTTTTTTAATTTTTAAMTTTTAATTTTTAATTTTTPATTSTPTPGRRKRNIEDKYSLAHANRQKRQTILNYGDISGLPISFGVVLPASCCNSQAVINNSTGIFYCISNANGVVNHFNTDGCARGLDVDAGNQALGFSIINSFLVVLAFVAIPLMLQDPVGI